MSDTVANTGIVCFSHGKESGPDGLKISELAAVAKELGWQVESLDYRGMDDPQARIDKLVAWCKLQRQVPVLAGSSMGGAVAAAAANVVPVRGVYLMAAAVNVSGYEHVNPQPTYDVPVSMVHGSGDDIIPFRNALKFALDCNARFVLTDDEHGLSGSLPTLRSSFAALLQGLPS